MFLFRDLILSFKKEIRTSLKDIYGVGWHKSNLIINKIGLSYPYYSINLNYYLINNILYLLKGLVVSESRIKRIIEKNIKRLLQNYSYRGIRHSFTLSVRGQRTRTNSGTQKKKRLKKKY